MHYHCEILMPPTDSPESAVKEIMEPFYEGDEENYRPFWDFWVIGGRFSGSKVQARLDPERVELFVAELQARKVTVSGVQFGKQTLQPASQIPDVDALWREWFPDSGLSACPIFDHAGDRLPDDVCRLVDLPVEMKAGRIIVAGPHWKDADRLEAKWMAATEMWNGVSWIKTVWNGTMQHALDLYEAYRERRNNAPAVGDDWLAVTVDYHT